jgi:hypothetical protein
LKRKKIMNKIVYIALFCLTSLVSFSQDDRLYDHDLDENRWEKLRDGIRYEGQESQKGGAGQRWTYPSNDEYKKAVEQYGSSEGSGSSPVQNGTGSGTGSGSEESGSQSYEPGDAPPDSPDYTPPPQQSNPPSRVTDTGLGIFGYILMGAFIVGLVFLIFYLWVKSPKEGKKITDEVVLEDINPIEIPLTELERLLKEAIEKGDYRGAVRIYFIFIIRDLTEKGYLQWEKEKTNFHYLREMSGKGEYDDFNRSVSYFEIIWYGKRELDLSKFNQVKPNFTTFLDKLGVK